MTDGLVTAVILTIGAVIGSFLNVVIIRSHADRSFFGGRSQCPACHKTLQWWELIPVLSYLFLRGRCAKCHHRIHWQYPVVELLTALSFYLTWRIFGLTSVMIAAWLVSAAMILVAIYDARWSLIPDSFTAALAIGAIVYLWLADRPWADHFYGLAAGGAFFGLQYILSRRRWVGSGDLFLGAVLGLLLGWRMLGLGLFLAYMIGSVTAIVLILSRRLRLRQSMPFGPYLLIGTYLAWLWGESIIQWYFDHALFL